MKRPGLLLTLRCWLSLLWLIIPPIYAGALSPVDLDPTCMFRDIQVLSGPEFLGRQTGTEGDLASAGFIARRFRELKLTPAGDIRIGSLKELWGQTGPVTMTQIQTPVFLTFTTTSQAGEFITFTPEVGPGFLPVLDSPSVHVTAPLVFVGYGISDPARGWDEYDGLDIRNRVVMFMRGKPSHYSKHIHHTEKERTARTKGALGFITLTGPVLSKYAARRGMGQQPLAFYTNAKGERPLPGAWISGETGVELFNSQGLSLQEIQETLNNNRRVQSKELNTLIHMKWESTQQSGSLVNVLGKIPGRDPALRDETVILGAHRDHFGEQAGLLFPGADDNASGTALILEIARILMGGDPPKRTILFASFSGEEQDLLGSTWYVQHPTHPLKKTIAMINVDHVGIGDGNLTVGISKIPKDVADRGAKAAGLSDKLKLYGFFPGGDHVPFANANVPTIAVVTAGHHVHFHQDSDTVDTIQPHRLQTAATFVLALLQQLADSE